MKKLMLLTAALAALLLILSACAQADVVKTYSVQSWNSIEGQFPNILNESDEGYEISADNETKLLVDKNYAGLDGDIRIMTPLAPFVEAGLDPDALGEGFAADEDSLYAIGEYGDKDDKLTSSSAALFQSVELDRNVLGYHTDLDHYGIALIKGKFEFAKDYTKNDKDLVFVLQADPIRDAGADVENIEGWVFKVMKDEKGNDNNVLLKPYDLG